VHTTAEVVIALLPGWQFRRELDAATNRTIEMTISSAVTCVIQRGVEYSTTVSCRAMRKPHTITMKPRMDAAA
jgi:hypothetical protein